MEDTGIWEETHRDPGCLSDITLLEMLDDGEDVELRTHLEHCPHCNERYHQLHRLQMLLLSNSYRLFCPSTDQLVDYRQGLLDSSERRKIMRHLIECPHCAAEMRLLRQSLIGVNIAALEPDSVQPVRIL